MKPAVLFKVKNVATKGNIAKTALSRLSHSFLCSFGVLASCESVSMTSFWLQKSSITSTVSAEFKVQVNSVCTYTRPIRNCGILIIIAMRVPWDKLY